MNRLARPSTRSLLAGTPKSALRRTGGSCLDSMWLDCEPVATSSSILSVLRDLMAAKMGSDGNLSRSLQDEAAKLRPLLALLEN